MPFLHTTTKQEIKQSRREKRRCKKTYPDWKDDEFNCGPLKFIWGVISPDDTTATTPSFNSMNDIEVYYNRDTQKYLLCVETYYLFQTPEEEIEYLEKLQKLFGEYLKNNKIKVNKKNYDLFSYRDGELFIANSIDALYFSFKIFVHGYKDLKRSRK